jgi:hypothetical protein
LDARVLNVDLDMPIDPNEPTYCYCHRVSFGEMVGCDNADVCAINCASLSWVTGGSK